jgi:hypothetical protein
MLGAAHDPPHWQARVLMGCQCPFEKENYGDKVLAPAFKGTSRVIR